MSKETALAFAAATPSLNVVPKDQPVQDQVVADATTTEVKPKPEDDLQSNRFAVLAKKEAQVVKEREAIKKQLEELNGKLAQAEEYIKRGREFDDLAKTDKVAALKKIGWSDSDIINILAANEKPEPTADEIARKVAQEETQKIRDELAEEKTKIEKETNQRLIAGLKRNIASTIKAKAEAFEACAHYGQEAEDLALEVITERVKEEKTFDEKFIDEALEDIEELYESQYKAMSALKKYQPKQVETVQPVTEAAPKSNVPQKAAAKPVVAPTPQPSSIPRRESHEEKKQRLIKALMNGGV